MADHLAAGLDALGQPGRSGGWKKRYEGNLASEKSRDRYDEAHRPLTRGAGEIGGAVLGVAAVGPMEGALAAAPRLPGAAARTSREAAAILGAGGATGLGMQALADGLTGRRSSLGDNAGAALGGVAGAAALPLGPASAGAIEASATAAAQDLFNGRPIAIDHASESAIAGHLTGGVAGVVGRGWANALPRDAKGRLGEALGDIRSAVNGRRRAWEPKERAKIHEGQTPYWYPDGVSDPVQFEDKFGVAAKLSRNQRLAQRVKGHSFQLYHFLPADICRAESMPAALLPRLGSDGKRER